MVARLKSITNRIPWSLLLKSFFLAIAWLWLPFYLFLALALFFYFIPLFRPRVFMVELLLILIWAALSTRAFWGAILLAVLFALLFGMKEFLIVERAKGYEICSRILLFALCVAFFSSPLASSWNGIGQFILGGGFGISTALLLRRIPFGEATAKPRLLPASIAGFLIAELIFILLFLPLNFFEASAILFSFIAGLVTSLAGWHKGQKGDVLIATSFALFTAITFAVFLLASWHI